MLDALRFVKGAVSTRDFVPEMKHFAIKDGMITAFDGVISLSSPIETCLEAAPKAVPMVAAISKCEEEVEMELTPSNRLHICSGNFEVFVDCIELDAFPIQKPEGNTSELPDNFLDAVRTVSDFIGTDASRPWSNGILFKEEFAYATNNICLIEYNIGKMFCEEPFNIPSRAVREILRIGSLPESVSASGHSVTFHYSGGRWLKTLLLSNEWPNLSQILDQEWRPEQVPSGLFEAIETVLSFTEEGSRVYLTEDGRVRTSPAEGLGASVHVPGLRHRGIYSGKMMTLLKGVAERIDLSRYPSHVLFDGDRVRGAIVGQRE